MDDVARLPARNRAELFAAAAARHGSMRAELIEKDFWVCWTLKRICLPSQRRPPLLRVRRRQLHQPLAQLLLRLAQFGQRVDAQDFRD
jgi:hypothetical protein